MGPGSLVEAIREVSDPTLVMGRVVDGTLSLIPAAQGAVVEILDGEELEYRCASGTLREFVGTRLNADESLSGQAVRSGQTLMCVDCRTDPRVNREVSLRVGAISMVCVPLFQGESCFGALKVTAPKPHAFAALDVQLLTTLAGFISVAVGASTALAEAAAQLMGVPLAGGAAGLELGGQTQPSQPVHPQVGAFVAHVLHPGLAGDVAARHRVERVLAAGAFKVLLQPIVDLQTGRLLGAEALARFAPEPQRSPDLWFAEAAAAGLGVQLELALADLALRTLELLPPDAFVAVNLGPQALSSPQLPGLLTAVDGERVVIELTEHVRVDDYPSLLAAIGRLRELGVRLAVDDIGAGFASLEHIVNLAPDLVKLDREFTRGIDRDASRRAVARALVGLSEECAAQAVAEGIETPAELETVRRLGIRLGQGYLMARPKEPGTIRPHYPVAGCAEHALNG